MKTAPVLAYLDRLRALGEKANAQKPTGLLKNQTIHSPFESLYTATNDDVESCKVILKIRILSSKRECANLLQQSIGSFYSVVQW